MADDEQFKQLWSDAFAAYEKETDRKLASDAATRNLKTVEDLIQHIEAQGASFTSWRTKHAKLWARLSACLVPISVISNIGKDAAQSTPYGAMAAPVLGAVVYLVNACQGVSDAYDWIERVFGELQDFADRLNLYRESKIDNVMEKKIAVILAFILKVIGRCEYLVARGRFRQYLRVVFLGKDDKTSKLMEELNESLSKEQSYVIAATYAAARSTDSQLKALSPAITDQLVDTSQRLSEIRGQQEEARGREITKEDEELLMHALETSAADRTLEINAELYKTLLAGTGAWLQKEPLFEAWSEQKVPILWVFGGPGSGKSHLSTWAINRLENLYGRDVEHPSGVSVGFFYVKENEAQLRDANTVLKTLAWQISQTDPVFKKHAVNVCTSKRNYITPESTWINIFLNFYRPVRTVDRSAILIIDGLDEAPKAVRTMLLGFSKDLLTEGPGGVRPRIQVAIIGRITLKGDVEFNREEKFIEVSREKNRDDMEKYMEKRLSEIELLKKLEKIDLAEARKRRSKSPKPMAPIVRKKLKDKITAYADGVFLWAQLLLDQIQKKEASEIEKILNNPPPSLEDMIRHVFERLAAEEEDLDNVRKLLTWMAYARRPLFFGEIDLILSLPKGTPNLLLWDAFRGKLSSIFQLAVPEGYEENADIVDDPASSTHTPDESTVDENNTATSAKDEAEEAKEVKRDEREENEKWDEGEEEEESDDADDASEFKLLDIGADRGLQALAFDEPIEDSIRKLHTYSDAQLSTVVTFSHQHFRDFLVPRHKRAPMPLDIDNKRSAIDITLTCFEILRLGYTTKRDSRYLADYPSRNFVYHLELIDAESATTEDKQKILEGLYWLFHDKEGFHCLFNPSVDSESDLWDELWKTWVASNDYTKIVREWFKEAKTFAHVFDNEKVAWMTAATYSTKELVRPWVTAMSRTWLEKTGFDDQAYLDKSERLVQLMHGFLSMDEDGTVQDENLRDFAFYQLDFSQISEERILYLADVAPLKDTPHWHTGLAWILMEGTYNESAIFHFNEALRFESDAWLPKEGLARIYGDQGRYPEAIKVMEEAIDELPKGLTFLGGFLLPRVASWKRKIGDHEGAYEAARQGWLAEDGSPLAQFHFLRALDAEGYSQNIIDVLKYLSETIWTESNQTLFERLLVLGYDVYDEVGRAYRATEKPSLIINELDKVVDIASAMKDEYMKMWIYGKIGIFKYEYNDQVDECMKSLEIALKAIATDTAANQKRNWWWKRAYENRLAQLYYDSATAARKTGRNAWPYTSKLKKLATVTTVTTDDTADAFDFYGTGYASILWGRWLRDFENADELDWRKCFRARILEELDMLDDNDPTNDVRGLHKLAISLLHAGDDVNAATILGLLFKPIKDARDAWAAEGGAENDDDDDDDENEDGSREGDIEEHEAEDTDENKNKDDEDEKAGTDRERDQKQEGSSKLLTGQVTPGNDIQGSETIELKDREESSTEDQASTAAQEVFPVPNETNGSLQEVENPKGGREQPISSDSKSSKTEVNQKSTDKTTSSEEPELSEDPVISSPSDLKPEASTAADLPTTTSRIPKGRLPLSLTQAYIHQCNGPCNINYWYYTELHVCKICLGKKFCQECIVLVKEEKLVKRDCNPEHAWYQAWPIPEGVWDIAAEEIEEVVEEAKNEEAAKGKGDGDGEGREPEKEDQGDEEELKEEEGGDGIGDGEVKMDAEEDDKEITEENEGKNDEELHGNAKDNKGDEKEDGNEKEDRNEKDGGGEGGESGEEEQDVEQIVEKEKKVVIKTEWLEGLRSVWLQV